MKSGSTLDARTRRAEREGFEPSIRVSTYAGLANRCLQPLGHLSRELRKLFSHIHFFNPLSVRRKYVYAVLGSISGRLSQSALSPDPKSSLRLRRNEVVWLQL